MKPSLLKIFLILNFRELLNSVAQESIFKKRLNHGISDASSKNSLLNYFNCKTTLHCILNCNMNINCTYAVVSQRNCNLYDRNASQYITEFNETNVYTRILKKYFDSIKLIMQSLKLLIGKDNIKNLCLFFF